MDINEEIAYHAEYVRTLKTWLAVANGEANRKHIQSLIDYHSSLLAEYTDARDLMNRVLDTLDIKAEYYRRMIVLHRNRAKTLWTQAVELQKSPNDVYWLIYASEREAIHHERRCASLGRKLRQL